MYNSIFFFAYWNGFDKAKISIYYIIDSSKLESRIFDLDYNNDLESYYIEKLQQANFWIYEPWKKFWFFAPKNGS